jgi:hypothetical protein
LRRDDVVTLETIGKARKKEEAPSEGLEAKNAACANQRAQEELHTADSGHDLTGGQTWTDFYGEQ